MTRSERALAAYDQCVDIDRRVDVMLAELNGAVEQDWMQCAQDWVLRRKTRLSEAVLSHALVQFPDSGEIAMALAGLSIQHGETERAETLLQVLLQRIPDHAAACFLLARLLKARGKLSAAARAISGLFRVTMNHDVDLVIQAVEFLDDCGHQKDAADICEAEIAAGSTDPRLFAYAGMLLSQLGQFELARSRREAALAGSDQAVEWGAALGLADQQRYADSQHHDFALFENLLRRSDLSKKAEASLRFASGKAHDDIQQFEKAADQFRKANALIHSDLHWSSKLWRRGIDARMRRRLPAIPSMSVKWTPIFIVGMPRSGTTLLAQMLARHPAVCHRGELSCMPVLADEISGKPDSELRLRMERASRTYCAQLIQDNSAADWFIDKQPDNYRHVDLILKMFPSAQFLYCERNARDNALSLWTQSFQPGAQQFSYDFSDIASAIQCSRRLMQHWEKQYSDSILKVRYEDLVTDCSNQMQSVYQWLGLPLQNDLATMSGGLSVISTASIWQARQPVHSRSIGRWKNYQTYLPELMRISEDG